MSEPSSKQELSTPVYKLLNGVESWDATDEHVRTAFYRAMKGKAYGFEPTLDAWLWFHRGWKDRPAVETPAVPCDYRDLLHDHACLVTALRGGVHLVKGLRVFGNDNIHKYDVPPWLERAEALLRGPAEKTKPELSGDEPMTPAVAKAMAQFYMRQVEIAAEKTKVAESTPYPDEPSKALDEVVALSEEIGGYDLPEKTSCECGCGATWPSCIRPAADEVPEKAATPQPTVDDETPCAIRDDGMHCECWYGGNKCCGCGDGDRTLGGEWPTCAEIRAGNGGEQHG